MSDQLRQYGLSPFRSFEVIQRSAHPSNRAVAVTFRGPVSGKEQTVTFEPREIEAMWRAINEETA